jgi:hypothetical protein
MYRKEINAASPLRILEASMHGGLGRGNVGVVMARPGVGKTACLIQIGLDDLLRERTVLHLALGGQTVEHIQSWYDALFEDLAQNNLLDDKEAVRAEVSSRRIIHGHNSAQLSPTELERIIGLYAPLNFAPTVVLVDGLDWNAPVVKTAATLGAFRALASRLQAEVWLSASTHREQSGAEIVGLVPPCDTYGDLIDVGLALYPKGDLAAIRLVKDHDSKGAPKDTTLHLRCDTMRLVVTGEHESLGTSRPKLPAAAYTLLSGGARGSEQAFGEMAEKYGVVEVHYSFAGRTPARTRGLKVLSEDELQRGDVSPAYVSAHMNRTYPRTDLFRKLLQSIWHQVNEAGQVFVVGLVLEDGTVKGGTGWAAELAKHLHKPVFVFDQERTKWLTWAGTEWVDAGKPVITARRFTGTGSSELSDAGRKAVAELFERSFA